MTSLLAKIRSGTRRFALAAFVLLAVAGLASAQPRNVILLIGDGMGFDHVKAASLYATGEEGRLFMEQLPVRGSVTTHAANAERVPDSATTGSSLATGEKVNVGVISVGLPGDGKDLPTILERLAKEGKRTGIVTTDSLAGATPAAFMAHADHRHQYEALYEDIFERTRPDILFGGTWKMPMAAAAKAGYHVVRTRKELDAAADAKGLLLGAFSPASLPYEYAYATRADPRYDTVPHLSEMTEAALRILSRGPKGFFLMVEGARIDHASHKNLLPHIICETLEFDSTVQTVLRWAGGRNDTLVLVTADHECGGLKVVEGRGPGEWPEVTWSSKGHTRDPVPLYVWGVGAEDFRGRIDNTDIPKRILALPAESDAVDQTAIEKLITSY